MKYFITCPRCDGTGYKGETDVPCGKCKGDGAVEAPTISAREYGTCDHCGRDKSITVIYAQLDGGEEEAVRALCDDCSRF